MAERFEALDAVIGAHAARTDATERKIILGVVQKRIVNRYVAGCGALEYLATILAVAAEKVERQWPSSSIDASDCLIDVAIGHDRQNRAEDFLVKDAHVIGRAENHGRWQRVRTRACGLGVFANLDHLCALGPGFVEESMQPAVVPLVDDRREIAAGRAVGIKRPHRLIVGREERVDLVLRNERIVRRDADLTALDSLPKAIFAAALSRE